MLGLDAYRARFSDEPGYFDFARVGPVGETALTEQLAMTQLLSRARFGSLAVLGEQDARFRAAVSALIRLPADQIVFQPNTSTGLMHALFGVTGGVLLSAGEFPSLTFATVRSAQALGVVSPVWVELDHSRGRGHVTPGAIREQLSSGVEAVLVSAVDSRTGYLADLEGIRQVIGDRLLIVDAIQGFGAVDAPWHLADAVISSGYKWARAGWGTGFLALSERALERITPVISGYTGAGVDEPWDAVPDPVRGASAFSVSGPDAIAAARFAAALEEVAEIGVPVIAAAIADAVSEVIDIADEFGLPVVSSRDESARAGIVVVEPPEEQSAVLTAALFNHGVTAKTVAGGVRLSAHATTGEESLAMLRAALTSYAAGVAY